MTTTTLNFPRESTLERIAVALERQSAMVQVLAKDNLTALATSWKDIQNLVREGLGPTVFHIGDQLVTKWKDVAANVEYDYVWDVVAFRSVTLKDGSVVPGMILQAHYATPFDMQFDEREALYYTTENLAAGTYNFTITSTWGKGVAGTYQFTLTQAVPAGGLIVGPASVPDVDPSTWTVKTYANGNAGAAVIETASVTSGSAGTSLGNFTRAGTETLNSMDRVAYGYNNYKQSAVRQWLNSKAAAGSWWVSQNKYDRAPGTAASKAGYMTGFADDFLNVLAETKVSVSTNTVTDNGVTDVMYDKFFLPSLEEEYYSPQASAGVEGTFWEYWKLVKGLASPQGWYGDNKNNAAIRYRVNAKTSAVYLWYRSADRSNGCNAWYGYTSGYCYYYGAYGALAAAPACVIA